MEHVRILKGLSHNYKPYILIFLKLIGTFVSFLTIKIFANLFELEGVGYFLKLNSYLLLFSAILSLGAENFITFKIPRLNHKTLEDNTVRNSIVLSILFTGALSFFLFLVYRIFNISFNLSQWVFIAFMFSALNQVLLGWLRGGNFSITYTASKFIQLWGLNLLLAILLEPITANLDVKEKVDVIFCLSLFLSLVINLCYYFFLKKKKIYSLKNNNLKHISLKIQLKESSSFLLTVVVIVCTQNLMVFLMDYKLDDSSIGIYTTYYKISNLIALPLLAFNSISAPKYSLNRNEIDIIGNISTKDSKKSGLLSILIFSFLLLFHDLILKLLGSDFEDNSIIGLLIILGSSQVISQGIGSSGMILQMTGKNYIFIRNTILSFIFGTFLFIILAERLGIIAAAISQGLMLIIISSSCRYYLLRNNVETSYWLMNIKKRLKI